MLETVSHTAISSDHDLRRMALTVTDGSAKNLCTYAFHCPELLDKAHVITLVQYSSNVKLISDKADASNSPAARMNTVCFAVKLHNS